MCVCACAGGLHKKKRSPYLKYHKSCHTNAMNVTFFPLRRCELIKRRTVTCHSIVWCQNDKDDFFFSSFLSAASKTVMMQDTPTAFTDCAAVFKSGNTQSGVYTLTLPNNTTEVKVKSFCLLRNNTTLLIKRRTCSALCWKGAAVECKCSQTFH